VQPDIAHVNSTGRTSAAHADVKDVRLLNSCCADVRSDAGMTVTLVEALDLYLNSYHSPEVQRSSAYQLLIDLQRSLHSRSSSLSSQSLPLLLSSLPATLLSPLRRAVEWLVAESRAHMEDESDARATAILQRIGEWSALKDAIEERERQVNAHRGTTHAARL